MTHTKDEVARIVAGLTKAQRAAIANATQASRDHRILVLPLYRDGGALTRSLVDLKLAGYSSAGAALNQLGKRVRTHILGEQVSAFIRNGEDAR